MQNNRFDSLELAKFLDSKIDSQEISSYKIELLYKGEAGTPPEVQVNFKPVK
jgi:hypothetical protein